MRFARERDDFPGYALHRLQTPSRKYYYVTDGEHSGVIDYNTGKVLIPLDRGYTYTRYNPAYNYIQVKHGDLIGACLEDGTELIPPEWFGCVFNSARGKFMVKSSPDKLWEEYKF